jgi:transcriptional regulator with XRE-family HTH domain
MKSDRTTRENGKASRLRRSSVERYKRQIALRLAEVRGSRSQRAFARDLDVFQQNVNRYENGTTPHADFLIALALQENVSLDWLLLGRGRRQRRDS